MYSMGRRSPDSIVILNILGLYIENARPIFWGKILLVKPEEKRVHSWMFWGGACNVTT